MKIHEAIALGGEFDRVKNALGIAIMFKMSKDRRHRSIQMNHYEARMDLERISEEEEEVYARPVGMARLVIESVCVSNGVSLADMVSKTRKSHIKNVRHIACWIAYKSCKVTYSKIGEIINRDHTTIIHSIKFCNSSIEMKDKGFIAMLDVALNALLKRKLILSKQYYLPIK